MDHMMSGWQLCWRRLPWIVGAKTRSDRSRRQGVYWRMIVVRRCSYSLLESCPFLNNRFASRSWPARMAPGVRRYARKMPAPPSAASKLPAPAATQCAGIKDGNASSNMCPAAPPTTPHDATVNDLRRKPSLWWIFSSTSRFAMEPNAHHGLELCARLIGIDFGSHASDAVTRSSGASPDAPASASSLANARREAGTRCGGGLKYDQAASKMRMPRAAPTASPHQVSESIWTTCEANGSPLPAWIEKNLNSPRTPATSGTTTSARPLREFCCSETS